MKGVVLLLVELKVKDKDIEYYIKLNRRVTIIQGDSGSGKTHLCSLVADSRRNPKINIQCNKEVYSFDNNIHSSMLKELKNSIIIIDEDTIDLATNNLLYKNSNLLECVIENDIYLIIISRSGVYDIPYSIYEVYEMYGGNNYKYFKPLYDRKLFNNKKYNEILNEDSSSGFDFYSEVEPKIKSITVKGNSNIIPKNKDDKKGKIDLSKIKQGYLYMIDLANFPFEFQYLYDLAKLGKIDICDRESFEQQLLKSSLFLDINLDEFNNNKNDYISWEDYFTDLLDFIMKTYANTNYSKLTLNTCFSNKCGYDLTKCNKCRLNKISNKKEDILKNNELDYLVNDNDKNDINYKDKQIEKHYPTIKF